jgi:cysteinyl-tRNA synthetase
VEWLTTAHRRRHASHRQQRCGRRDRPREKAPAGVDQPSGHLITIIGPCSPGPLPSVRPEDSPTGEAIPVRLYNSLTRRLDAFRPRHGHRARVYTCGPTVYNYAHMGNLRAYVFADTLRRTLQWKRYDVLHVINVTDVGHLTSDADEGEDKVELAAWQAHRSASEITQQYTDAFFADLTRLGVRPAAVYARATQHIQEMIGFVEVLQRRVLTYEIADGVYFDTARVDDYGRLGALDLQAQVAGARVTSHPDKRHPWDFCLWRRSLSGSARLMEWYSPWGRGFPGWHLECSVMSLEYLGGPFDIHTGGVDHRQVHHPNEAAQNQGYLGTSDSGANYWLHSEFLVMRQPETSTTTKMSKSTGDFWRLKSMVDCGIHLLVYRYFLPQAHYRSQVDFSLEALAGAQVALERVLNRVRHLIDQTGADGQRLASLAGEADYTIGGSLAFVRRRFEVGLGETAGQALRQFDETVSEDLGTPKALALLGAVLFDPALDPLDTLRVAGSFDLDLGAGSAHRAARGSGCPARRRRHVRRAGRLVGGAAGAGRHRTGLETRRRDPRPASGGRRRGS